MIKRSFPTGTIGPNDLALLQDVLEEVLSSNHIALHSDTADDIASRLIELYQSGIRDRAELLARMKPLE